MPSFIRHNPFTRADTTTAWKLGRGDRMWIRMQGVNLDLRFKKYPIVDRVREYIRTGDAMNAYRKFPIKSPPVGVGWGRFIN